MAYSNLEDPQLRELDPIEPRSRKRQKLKPASVQPTPVYSGESVESDADDVNVDDGSDGEHNADGGDEDGSALPSSSQDHANNEEETIDDIPLAQPEVFSSDSNSTATIPYAAPNGQARPKHPATDSTSDNNMTDLLKQSRSGGVDAESVEGPQYGPHFQRSVSAADHLASQEIEV